MESFLKADQGLNGYYDILQEQITLMEQGDKEGAVAIHDSDPGFEVWKTWHAFATEAMQFEQARYEAAKARNENLLKLASVMQILLMVIGAPTLFLVAYQLRRSARRRVELFSELATSQQQYLFAHQDQEAQPDERSIITRLIQSLEQAASFIKQIAQGNYR